MPVRGPLMMRTGATLPVAVRPKIADRAVAAVGDGHLVVLGVESQGHRPVEAGLGPLDPARRRDVAGRLARIDRDRRLVEASADERAAARRGGRR